MSGTTGPFVVSDEAFATCLCGARFNTNHSYRLLSLWSTDVELCRGVVLPLHRQYGKCSGRHLCPQCLRKLHGEFTDMAVRRRKPKKDEEPTAVAVAVVEDEPTSTSDAVETEEKVVSEEFSWDGGTTEQPADETGNVATAAPTDGEQVQEDKTGSTQTDAESTKAKLQEEFPIGETVTYIKTDWKGAWGKVEAFVDKRNVIYIQVRLTHFANGKPRPEDKQTLTDVRPSSIEKSEPPAQPEPEPEQPELQEQTAE